MCDENRRAPDCHSEGGAAPHQADKESLVRRLRNLLAAAPNVSTSAGASVTSRPGSAHGTSGNTQPVARDRRICFRARWGQTPSFDPAHSVLPARSFGRRQLLSYPQVRLRRVLPNLAQRLCHPEGAPHGTARYAIVCARLKDLVSRAGGRIRSAQVIPTVLPTRSFGRRQSDSYQQIRRGASKDDIVSRGVLEVWQHP
jgi:hypothetical protein